MVIATFFVQVSGFSDPKSREAFAATMLDRNRFLFSDSEGDDRKVRTHLFLVLNIISWQAWSGIWRSPFVLQTFASHLNFIAGRYQIPELNSEAITAQGALALAVTAASFMKSCKWLLLINIPGFLGIDSSRSR